MIFYCVPEETEVLFCTSLPTEDAKLEAFRSSVFTEGFHGLDPWFYRWFPFQAGIRPHSLIVFANFL